MKTRPDPSSKPYYRCLSCMRFGISCSGHSTRDMNLQSWCEYMRDVKEAKHLTNAYIANAADVSIKTIERIMAISIDQDIMRETARKIEVAVIGTSNQYPCYLAFEESIPDNTDYKAELATVHASYNAEIQTFREGARAEINHLLADIEWLNKQIDFLKRENEQKNKIIDKFLE